MKVNSDIIKRTYLKDGQLIAESDNAKYLISIWFESVQPIIDNYENILTIK